MVKAIVLHFPLGLEVTARNLKGVTIKDACDAIYKQFKKKVRTRDLRSNFALPNFRALSQFSTNKLTFTSSGR